MAELPQTLIRLHIPLLKSVQAGLKAVLKDGQPIDKFLLTIKRNRQFGSRDRRFIASNIYDIVRYKRLFETVLKETGERVNDKYTAFLIMNMASQGKFISDPDRLIKGGEETVQKWKVLLDNYAEDVNDRITESFPDWMWEIGMSEYEQDWPSIASGLNQSPAVYIRTNTLKTTPDALAADLQKKGVDCEWISGTDAIELKSRANLTNDNLYRKGHFEFQDLASQHVSIMAEPDQDMIVLDACAGAGGKSLHLASLVKDSGRIIASDKIPGRMKQLNFRASRNGVKNLELLDYDQLHTLEGKVDRVILDVPCTASGTIGRKPEIKWRLKPEDIERYTSIQSGILDNSAALVNSNGWIVYATCSIFRKEGEDIVNAFLQSNSAFKLKEERRFCPPADRTDGFYIAVLSRTA